MEALFEGPASWFSVPAFLGTGVFLIRMVMMLIGGVDGGHGGGDTGGHIGDMGGDFGDAGGDFGHAGDVSAGHVDSGHAFEVLSIQSIAAFLMGFGWAGLAAFNGGWPVPVAVLVGVTGGSIMVWFLAMLLRGLYSLESSGNVSISSTLGSEGEVYTRIPPKGKGFGQVRLVVSDRQRIYNAVTEGPEVPSNARVRVTRVNPDNTITVELV